MATALGDNHLSFVRWAVDGRVGGGRRGGIALVGTGAVLHLMG